MLDQIYSQLPRKNFESKDEQFSRDEMVTAISETEGRQSHVGIKCGNLGQMEGQNPSSVSLWKITCSSLNFTHQ